MAKNANNKVSIWQSLHNAWKVQDIRKKLIYTFFMLILFRLVGVIPAPGVDYVRVKSAMSGSNLPLLDLVNMMTGSNFSNMTIMAMGITPYINSSIIMQLLTIAIPALERLSKSGPDGQKKIASITRYVTVVLAVIQAIGLVYSLGYIKSGWFNTVLVGVSMAAGTALAMWIGERITANGLGNGVSLLIFAGIICTMAYNVASGILRGIGDSRTPLYFLIFSSALNIALDIFLIVAVKLGTAGAAYATVISQGVAAALCFVVMFKKYDILRTSRDDYYWDLRGIGRMLSIGIPMALNYSITAIGTMILQSAINVFGSGVVAAFTAASKVSNIATQTMPTMGTAMATYCGQNLGAGKYERIYHGMKNAFFLSFIAAGLAAAICCLAGPYMIGWFIKNPSAETVASAMRYLYIASIFMLPLAWIFIYRNALQGLNRGIVPMFSGVLELVSRYVVILFAAKPYGYTGVCFADPFAWLTTGILLIVTYILWKRKMKRNIIHV